MRRVELDHRLDVQIDTESDPVDIDEALARFLLAHVRNTSRSSPVAPDGAVEFQNDPER